MCFIEDVSVLILFEGFRPLFTQLEVAKFFTLHSTDISNARKIDQKSPKILSTRL